MIDEEIEKLKQTPPDARELTRALNQMEASFFRRMERTGGFGGKADQLNGYYFATGMPDYFEQDLARYRAVSPTDVQSAAATLPAEGPARRAHRHGGEVIMVGSRESGVGSRRASRWLGVVLSAVAVTASAQSRRPIDPSRRRLAPHRHCGCRRFRSPRSPTACRSG